MEDQELNLRGILGTLKRQAFVIGLSVFVVLGVTATVVLSLDPVFRATTLVLVDPSDKNLLDPTTSALTGAAENARIESAVVIAKSETTLDMVINELRLTDDPEFQPRPGLREQVMVLLRLETPRQYTPEQVQKHVQGALRSSISVNRQGATYLVEVSARAGTPEKAALLANTMARMYVRAQLQSKVDSVLTGREVLAERISETRAELVAAEQAFNDFVINSAAAIAVATGRSDLEQIRLELESLVLTRERLSAQLELAEAGLAQENWIQVANALETEALRGLQQREAQLRDELAGVLAGSQASNDLRRALLATLDEIRATAASEIDKLQRTIADQRARESDLQLQLRTAILASNLPAEVLATMYELQQNSEITRSQYQQVLARLREIEAQAYLQIADSRVVSEATPPSSSFFPNISQALFLAALGGLVAGVALAFLRENFVGGIVDLEQLDGMPHSTQVAAMPNQARLSPGVSGKKLTSLAEYVIEHPYSIYTESVRRLMVMTDQIVLKREVRSKTGQATVILVTSANANEGKTTLAASLTRVFALTGRSTITIDADMRQPSLHKALGLAPSQALASYLNTKGNERAIGPFLQDDTLTPAKVMAGGEASGPSAGQIVSSERFLRLLENAVNDFDVVIVDTPPVGAVVDALYLAQFADVLINVVRYGTTTYRDVRSTLNELSEALQPGANIVSVLSAQPQSRSENKRRFRGYYTQ